MISGLSGAFLYLRDPFSFAVDENHYGIGYRPPSINVHQLWSQEHSMGNNVDQGNLSPHIPPI
jgi:hypothetical protein